MTDQKICVSCGEPFTPSKRGVKGLRLHCSFRCYQIAYYALNRVRIIKVQQLRRKRTGYTPKKREEHVPSSAKQAHLFNGSRSPITIIHFQKMPAEKIVRNWPFIVRNWNRIWV